eukprot:6373932-Pyramimonas_sp.AAC.1
MASIKPALLSQRGAHPLRGAMRSRLYIAGGWRASCQLCNSYRWNICTIFQGRRTVKMTATPPKAEPLTIYPKDVATVVIWEHIARLGEPDLLQATPAVEEAVNSLIEVRCNPETCYTLTDPASFRFNFVIFGLFLTTAIAWQSGKGEEYASDSMEFGT